MNIAITCSTDFHFTGPFIKKLIRQLREEVKLIVITNDSIDKVHNQSNAAYALTLLLIMGPWTISKMVAHSLFYKACNMCSFLTGGKNILSVEYTAQKLGIPVLKVKSIRNPECLKRLKAAEPDIVINQANAIIKKDLLELAKIGWLNRHGALLPKYKGRMAPFWAYKANEKEIGVSIHFLEETIDSGPILVQRHIPITRFDSLNSLVKKVFDNAPGAMLEAIDLLRTPGTLGKHLIPNQAGGDIFPSPTLADVSPYWKMRIKRLFGHE